MLSAVEPVPPIAYEVPWHIDRISETHPVITNRGPGAAEFVRTFGSDGSTRRWGRLEPGETIDLCLCGTDLDDVVMTLCWFRADTGVEYVWRFVM